LYFPVFFPSKREERSFLVGTRAPHCVDFYPMPGSSQGGHYSSSLSGASRGSHQVLTLTAPPSAAASNCEPGRPRRSNSCNASVCGSERSVARSAGSSSRGPHSDARFDNDDRSMGHRQLDSSAGRSHSGSAISRRSAGSGRALSTIGELPPPKPFARKKATTPDTWQVPTHANMRTDDDMYSESDGYSYRTCTTIREFFEDEHKWATGGGGQGRSAARARPPRQPHGGDAGIGGFYGGCGGGSFGSVPERRYKPELFAPRPEQHVA